ncbi:hypothetical protein VTK26DRAFT_3483 [Humicola hyalothermophila]
MPFPPISLAVYFSPESSSTRPGPPPGQKASRAKVTPLLLINPSLPLLPVSQAGMVLLSHSGTATRTALLLPRSGSKRKTRAPCGGGRAQASGRPRRLPPSRRQHPPALPHRADTAGTTRPRCCCGRSPTTRRTDRTEAGAGARARAKKKELDPTAAPFYPTVNTTTTATNMIRLVPPPARRPHPGSSHVLGNRRRPGPSPDRLHDYNHRSPVPGRLFDPVFVVPAVPAAATTTTTATTMMTGRSRRDSKAGRGRRLWGERESLGMGGGIWKWKRSGMRMGMRMTRIW